MKTAHRYRALMMMFFSLSVGISSSLLYASYANASEESNAAEESEAVLSTSDEAANDAPAVLSEQPLEPEQALGSVQVDYAAEMAEASTSGDDFESDPWESFNEKMFWFNREVLDRYILKPAATAWDFVLPDAVQRGIHNVFDNLKVVQRVVNNTLQLKFAGAATEVARFTINSTVGFVGFFDVAKAFEKCGTTESSTFYLNLESMVVLFG